MIWPIYKKKNQHNVELTQLPVRVSAILRVRQVKTCDSFPPSNSISSGGQSISRSALALLQSGLVPDNPESLQISIRYMHCCAHHRYGSAVP